MSPKSAKFKGLLGTGLIAVATACGGSSHKEVRDPYAHSLSEYDVAKDLWLRQNRAREALKHALDAVEMDKQNSDAAHLVALIYLKFCERSETEGMGALDECKLAEAERHARLALASKSDFLEAKNTLGLVLIHRKRYREAVSVLLPLAEDILYQTPEIAWGNLGWAYLQQGNLTRAIDALQRSVAAEPSFCVGWYRMGLARMRRKNLQAADEAFTEALTRDPRCQGLQAAYLQRGHVRRALGRDQAAKEDLEHCVKLGKRTNDGKECASLLANLQYSRAPEWGRSVNTFASIVKRSR